MAYRAAILGCGPRAAVHMAAYEGLGEIQLVAACDMNRQRLDDAGAKFGIEQLYEQYEAMLEAQRPDIVHIVTPPAIREEPIELAARYSVRGILVEKPIALRPAQVERIKTCVARSGIKIAVNMQRRYFDTCQQLRQVIRDGAIGKLEFVRCVTKGNILSMGPHMIDLLLFLLDDVAPTDVWATAYGMNGYDYAHPAPANMLMAFTFPNQVVAYCEDGDEAVGTAGETGFWQHLELDLWASGGRAWWLQNREWGYQAVGMSEPITGTCNWDHDDLPGQREFTRAMAGWLDDDANVHLNCLDNTLRGFDAIMGAIKSSLVHRRLTLPTDIPDDILTTIEQALS